ncbi:MAG: response regulator [Terracidiphilus sp.]
MKRVAQGSLPRDPERGTIMPQPQQQLSVFVVDDEDVIATTLAMILRLQGGFCARSFNQPQDALEAAQLEAPDLLISDVVMPQISGIDLAIRVRECCPDCKVLLFSGQASTAYLLEAAKADGHDFDFLTKPVHPTDLLIKIRSLIEPASALQSTGD